MLGGAAAWRDVDEYVRFSLSHRVQQKLPVKETALAFGALHAGAQVKEIPPDCMAIFSRETRNKNIYI